VSRKSSRENPWGVRKKTKGEGGTTKEPGGSAQPRGPYFRNREDSISYREKSTGGYHWNETQKEIAETINSTSRRQGGGKQKKFVGVPNQQGTLAGLT